MVRHTSLALALLGTLGLAAGPNTAFGMATGGASEATSALITGAVLLLLATAARRAPAVRK